MLKDYPDWTIYMEIFFWLIWIGYLNAFRKGTTKKRTTKQVKKQWSNMKQRGNSLLFEHTLHLNQRQIFELSNDC